MVLISASARNVCGHAAAHFSESVCMASCSVRLIWRESWSPSKWVRSVMLPVDMLKLGKFVTWLIVSVYAFKLVQKASARVGVIQ